MLQDRRGFCSTINLWLPFGRINRNESFKKKCSNLYISEIWVATAWSFSVNNLFRSKPLQIHWTVFCESPRLPSHPDSSVSASKFPSQRLCHFDRFYSLRMAPKKCPLGVCVPIRNILLMPLIIFARLCLLYWVYFLLQLLWCFGGFCRMPQWVWDASANPL